MIPRSIGGQLTVALLMIVAIAALLVASGTLIVLRAEQDFRSLAENHIPRVALAGELAEFSADLAALSARIAADPRAAGEDLRPRIGPAATGIAAVLNAPSLANAPERRTLLLAEARVRSALAAFTATSAELDRLERRVQAMDQDLRWIHADVQDQVGAVLRDLSFDMDAQLDMLTEGSGTTRGLAAQQRLMEDQQVRDRLQRLASESATLATLLLQARSTVAPEALEAIERMAEDTIDSIALTRLQLPDRTDVRMVLDALDRLIGLAVDEDGVTNLTARQIALRQAAVRHLADAQEALSRFQADLSTLGREERLAAQAAADRAAQAVVSGSFWLSGLTIAGALGTAGIFLLFVRHRILRRIRALSTHLGQIAAGDVSAAPKVHGGSDEIADMERAVEVFRTSVRDLRRAHCELSVEVAERRRAVERLEVTQRELVQAGKMAALGQMSAAIGHEINQPLAAMRHRLHGLRTAHPEARQAVERVEALVGRISGIIGHLRRIARRSDHRRTCVPLATPVAAALDLLEHRLRSEVVEVTGLETLKDIDVEGDEILLEQVLLNVLGNAVDAISETRRGRGRIVISTLAGADDVVLCVRDDGVGIGDHEPAALIDPFFTTKEVGQGLGLGLSIAYNVMQDMGGGLEIGDGGEGGAEVRLRLRLWPGESSGVRMREARLAHV